MNQQDRCLWLIRALLKEMPQYAETPVPVMPEQRWRLLRSLMNVRPPMPASEEFLRVQADFLREMTLEKGITDAAALPGSWRRIRAAKASPSAASQPASLCFRIRGQLRLQWKPFGIGWTRPEAG